jgi:hypothetical protein
MPLLSLITPCVIFVEYDMCSLLLFQPHQLDLWSTSQLSLWSWSFRLKIGVFYCCRLSKVIFFVLIRNIISIVFWYYPLFVAICVIWLSGLTYGVYLVLFLKPGATFLISPFFWKLVTTYTKEFKGFGFQANSIRMVYCGLEHEYCSTYP